MAEIKGQNKLPLYITTDIFKPCVFYVSIFFSRNTVLKFWLGLATKNN